ncbi:MAG: hypothetical protein U0798_18005 [Gemmataceae bacterium]
MPWVVGIDEAGYGPNLGPLSQACVGLYLPADDPGGWATVARAVRRVGDPVDDRLLVDDSKAVYTGKNGFEELERTVIALSGGETVSSLCVDRGVGEPTVGKEFWFHPDEPIPLQATRETCIHAREFWRNQCSGEVGQSLMISTALTATKRFNELVDQSGSKATVIMDRLATFFRTAVERAVHPTTGSTEDPIHFTCDKLGGRNFYGPMLMDTFPDGWPVAVVEGALESRYRILNLGRDITVSFRPRADGENICVAMASMVAKYARELCMKQFNEYWAALVPGISPTAGYPVDAKRFLSEIRTALKKKGHEIDEVWRKK